MTRFEIRGRSAQYQFTRNAYDSLLKERLIGAFKALENLENDWDSYGALAPSQRTIEICKRLCSHFLSENQPEIQPETDGSIGLYWEKRWSAGFLVSESKIGWVLEDLEGDYIDEGELPISLAFSSTKEIQKVADFFKEQLEFFQKKIERDFGAERNPLSYTPRINSVTEVLSGKELFSAK